MAEAALRVGGNAGFGEALDTNVVRRLMARPIRSAAVPQVAWIVPTPPVLEDEPSAPDPIDADGDVGRLRSEIMVMKAVLRAERAAAEGLRADVERLAGPAPISPEARAVRDRWAALVDQLLNEPR